MMGTLAAELASRKIPTYGDRYRADIEGDIEDVDGVMKIVRIRVRYTLKAPPGKSAEARGALENYLTRCPAAMSVTGCIELLHSLDVTELEA